MCHSRGLNNRINKLHERALRIVYQEKKRDFETLLKNEKSYKNLREKPTLYCH